MQHPRDSVHKQLRATNAHLPPQPPRPAIVMAAAQVRSSSAGSGASLAAKQPSAGRHCVIIGGGSIGSNLAYFLCCTPRHTTTAASVMRVTLLDPCADAAGGAFEPPAASGRAGGFLAHGWSDGPEGALSALSFALHRELAATLKAERGEEVGYRALDTLQVAMGKKRQQKKGTGGGGGGGGMDATALPVPCAYLDTPTAATALLGAVAIGSRADTAQVSPHLLVPALQRAALATGRLTIVRGLAVGLEMREGGGSSGGDSGGGGGGGSGEEAVAAVLLEGGGRLECTEVALAAGPWSDAARGWGGGGGGGGAGCTATTKTTPFASMPRVLGQKAHSVVLAAGDVDAVALFTGGLRSKLSGDAELYPRPDGTVYVCGETEGVAPVAERPGEVAAVPGACEALRQNAAALSSACGAAEVLRAVACHLPVSATGSPLIGSLGAGCFCATGHSCWGILNGPATGKALAELIVDGEASCLDLRPFAPI
jgi:glycine/D-amino acid oxidase-like deaminating enzyme